VGSYTCTDKEACITSLPNNGRLNHVLKVAGVAYGPRPVPISVKVLKKRKAYAATKVSAKPPKVPEKKGAELAMVSGARASGGSKWTSGADVSPMKSMKLSKYTVPRAIALAVMAHSEDLLGASGSKAGGRRPSCKIVSGAKVAPSAMKRIIPTIGALAVLSSEGIEESSLHDQAPEVRSKVGPPGLSAEPQAQSMMTSGPRDAPQSFSSYHPFHWRRWSFNRLL
jgi:hypothetical protein